MDGNSTKQQMIAHVAKKKSALTATRGCEISSLKC
jgi:hypothetical protein